MEGIFRAHRKPMYINLRHKKLMEHAEIEVEPENYQPGYACS